MTVEEVIENELKCVQRDCCRLENECAKCDLVLPKEEIINAYNKALKLEIENVELKDKLNNISKVAEVRLANWQKYEQENAELKKKVSYLEDNLRVARKDRENLQLDVAKGLKEFVKDYPATALRYLANEKYVEKLTKAKEIIRDLLSCLYSVEYDCVSDLEEAEQFLKEDK